MVNLANDNILKLKPINEVDPEAPKSLACPNCARYIDKKLNYRVPLKIWRCYRCRTDFERPVLKRRDFFKDTIAYKIVRRSYEDEDGNVVKGEYITEKVPIKRFHKRKFTDDEIVSRQQILEQIKENYRKMAYGETTSKKGIRNIAFICFLFLTGARLEEVIGIPLRDEDNQVIENKWIVDPIKKHQISKEYYERGEITVWKVKSMPVLKHKKNLVIDNTNPFDTVVKPNIPRRDVIVPLHIEKEFVHHIDTWLDSLDDEDIVFDFKRRRGWDICNIFNKKYCHYWRHIRATDLLNTYHFQSLQLKHFFGWSSEEMARRYTHLTNDTLLDSMIYGLDKK